MPDSAPQTLRSMLERLRNAGAVNGFLLGWRRQMVANGLPFSEGRAERLLQEALDARAHFGSGGDREIKTLWFGYDTVHVLTLFWREVTLVILHARADEVDFLRRAGQTCLEDAQWLIETVLEGPKREDEEHETQRLTPVAAEGEETGKTNFISGPM